MEEVAADAAAARHLAAARDRDLADLGIKVDANRSAINALGVQTAARFDRVDERVDRLEAKVDAGFTEMRGKLDQTAAGMQQIVDLLTRRGDQPPAPRRVRRRPCDAAGGPPRPASVVSAAEHRRRHRGGAGPARYATRSAGASVVLAERVATAPRWYQLR